MNAHGAGVQLQRAPCFTEACRALWPGAGHMNQSVVDAFSLLGGIGKPSPPAVLTPCVFRVCLDGTGKDSGWARVREGFCVGFGLYSSRNRLVRLGGFIGGF